MSEIYYEKVKVISLVLKDLIDYQRCLTEEDTFDTVPNLYMIYSEIQKCLEKYSNETNGDPR